MIGWIILAVAFFLFGAGCVIDDLVHRRKYDRALGERDTWRTEAHTAWTKCASAEEALLVAQDERATLKLQLTEATRPKPRRGGTKKAEVEP